MTDKVHYANIDLLRIFAASSVVVFHVGTMLDSKGMEMDKLNGLQTFLSSGVYLFFVISGFVISTSIFSKEKISIFSFYKSRIRRIVPLYAFLTILTFLLFNSSAMLGYSKIQFSLEELMESLFFAAGLSNSSPPIVQQGWTLEFEMGFYAIIAFSLFLKNFRNSLIASIILLFVISVSIENNLFLLFALGIILSFLIKTFHTNSFWMWVIGISLFTLIATLVVCEVVSLSPFLYGLFYSVLIFCFINSKQLDSNFVITLGQISYATYLIQGIILSATYQIISELSIFSLPIYLFATFSVLMSCIVTGYLLNKYFEKPISRKMRTYGW
jgi:exopolysaccharide production protein ExoZ